MKLPRRLPRSPKRLLVLGAVALAVWLAQQAGFDLANLQRVGDGGGNAPVAAESPARTGEASGEADARIERAVANQQSGFMVTVEARVVKRLPDDNEGSRHQRFIIELASGRTLLVAHNIDLAKRAPIQEGDRVRVRGQYEWNPRGGVLHWTHHDPDGDHPGGWIEARGQRVE